MIQFLDLTLKFLKPGKCSELLHIKFDREAECEGVLIERK